MLPRIRGLQASCNGSSYGKNTSAILLRSITAQALIAIADFISPVLGGFVLGYALYGVWIGIAISVAIIGLVTAMIYLSKSSVLIAKPETE